MTKGKELVEAKTITPEERNYKNLLKLKKTLIKAARKKAKQNDLKDMDSLLRLIGSLDTLLNKPLSYFEIYNYLRARRFDEDVTINEDDLKEFDKLFGGEVDGKDLTEGD